MIIREKIELSRRKRRRQEREREREKRENCNMKQRMDPLFMQKQFSTIPIKKT